MKSINRFFEKWPLYLRTGILGGIIYFVWAGLSLFAQAHWNYYGLNFFIGTLTVIILVPAMLEGLISDALIDRALEAAQGAPVETTGYHVIGYLLCCLLSIALGMVLGKIAQDPHRREINGEQILVIICVLIALCVCFAMYMRALAYLMM